MNKTLKKVLCGLTTGVMMASYIPSELVFAADPKPLGDVNLDGSVTQEDVDALATLLAGSMETLVADENDTEHFPTYYQADVNSDFMVDAADLRMLGEFVAGKIKAYPAEFGGQIDENITVAVSNSFCTAGSSAQVDIAFADWAQKDIYAYDIIVTIPKGFTAETVNPTDGGYYVLGKGQVRLYGSLNDTEKARGKVASLHLKSEVDASGEYEVGVAAANVYTSQNTFYHFVANKATIQVADFYAPVGLTAEGVSSNSISLSWVDTFVSDSLAGYRIFRDGEMVGESTEACFRDTELEAGGEYTYTVAAVDDDGDLTDESLPLTVKTLSPEIKLLSFDEQIDKEISVDTAALRIELNGKINLSELEVSFISGEKAVLTESVDMKGSAYSSILHHPDISKLTSGSYAVSVTVKDVDGVSATLKTTIDVQMDAPKPVSLSAEAKAGYITLTWDVGKEADVVKYRIYRKTGNETAFTLLAEVNGRQAQNYSDKNLDRHAEYSYTVSAVNCFGLESQQSEPVTLSPALDEDIPMISTFSIPNYSTTTGAIAGNLYVEVQASDGNQVKRVALLIAGETGDEWTEIFSNDADSAHWTLDTTKYADGTYRLKAKAYDDAGNESPDTALKTVHFDNTAPDKVKNVRIESLLTSKAMIKWDDVEADDRVNFRIILTGESSTGSYTSKTIGYEITYLTANTPYQVVVAAVDRCGNIGEYSDPIRFCTNEDVEGPVITKLITIDEKNSEVKKYYYNTEDLHNIRFRVSATDDSTIKSYALYISQDKETWRHVSTFPNTTLTFSNYYYSLNDGPVYFRVLATDNYYNTTPSEKSIIVTVMLDNTPHEPVSFLYGVQGQKGIHMFWEDLSAEEEVAGYVLERKLDEADDSAWELCYQGSVADFDDITAMPDVTYAYRVKVIDDAGNIGEYCKPYVITCAPDTIVPQVGQVYLASVQNVCEAQRTLQILSSDNAYIDGVEVMYALDSSDIWKEITDKNYEYNNTHKECKCTVRFPDAVFAGTKLKLRITAIDGAGNRSTTVSYTYAIDNTKTEMENPTISCTKDGVQIEWECPSLTGTTFFDIMRSCGDEAPVRITSVEPLLNQTAFQVFDKNITKTATYRYSIVAYRKNANTTTYSFDPMELHAFPKASLECSTAQEIGAEYRFDATKCTLAEEITSIRMDFGDGKVETATNVKDALFKHSYTETGTYHVTLTCANASEFSDTVSVDVVVAENNMLGQVNLLVRTLDGEAAAGVSVYVDIGNPEQMILQTDENGKLSFWTTRGAHEIGVLGSGYLPVTETIAVSAGINDVQQISVVKNELVDAHFTVTRMTLEEIKAAGIDTSDPDNTDIIHIDIKLKYENPNANNKLSILYNQKTGKSNTKGYTVYSKPEINAIVLLTIPTEVRMLKEFFRVDMVIINNASADFSLKDCNVTLNPNGLTIMEDADDSSPRNVSIPSIPGQGQHRISWILRGDTAGRYSISADFSATLSTFNEPVRYNFEAPDPIVVDGTNALEVTVNVDTTIVKDRMYLEMRVKNISSNPQYKISTDVGNVLAQIADTGLTIGHPTVSLAQTRMIGTDGILKVLDKRTESLDTLNPGETFSVMYILTDFSPQYAFNYLKALGGSLTYQATGGGRVKVQLVSNLQTADVNSIFYGIKFDPNKQYMLVVRNRKGKALQGVDVKVHQYGVVGDYFTGVTDEKGRVIIPRTFGDENFWICTKLEGYDDYHNWDFYFPSSTSKTHEYICMKNDKNTLDLEVTTAIVRSGNIRYENVMTRPLSIFHSNTLSFDITIGGAYDATEYALVQNGKVLKKVSAKPDGEKVLMENIPIETMELDSLIYIRAYASTGDFVDNRTQFKILRDPDKKITTDVDAMVSQILDGTTIPVVFEGDVIPILSGKNFEIEFPEYENMEATIEIWDDEGVVGISVEVGENPPEREDKGNEKKKKNKKKIKKEKEFDFAEASKNWHFGGLEFSVSFGITIEGEMDLKTGETTCTGVFAIAGEASGTVFKGQAPTFPFYASLDVTLSLGLEAELKYNTVSGFSTEIRLAFKPELTLSGLLGFSGIIGIGAYGSAELSLLLRLLPTPIQFTEVKIEGDLGAAAEFLGFKQRWPILSGTWNIIPKEQFTMQKALEEGMTVEEYKEKYKEACGRDYDTDTMTKALEAAVQNGMTIKEYKDEYYRQTGRNFDDDWNEAMKRAEEDLKANKAVRITTCTPDLFFRPMTREELERPTVWTDTITDDGSLTTLLANAKSDAQPVLCSDGNNLMMVWLQTDVSRGTGNSSQAVFSVFDPETDKWSNPQAIDSNNSADFYPTVYAASDGIHVAYLESKEVFEDANTMMLSEFAAQLQIATAKYDPETGAFVNYQTLDANANGGTAMNLQFMEETDGKLYLLWQSSESDDLFFVDQTGYVAAAELTEEGFSEPVRLAEKVYLLDYTCGLDENGKLQIAYVISPDGNLNDLSNSQLMLKSIVGTSKMLSKGIISHVTYSTLPMSGKSDFVWLQDGVLSTCGKEEGTTQSILNSEGYSLTGEYSICDDRILFLAATGNDSALCSASYDAETGTIQSPIVLDTVTDGTFNKLSAAKLNDDTVYTVNAFTVEGEEDNLTSHCNVCCGMVADIYDLAVTNVDFDRTKAVSESVFPIDVTVRNNGSVKASGMTLTLTNEKGAAIASQVFEDTIASGEESVLHFEPTLGTIDGAVTYHVSVSDANHDSAPEDNTAAIDLTLTDLAIETEIMYLEDENGESTQVTLLITNYSNVPAPAFITASTDSDGVVTSRFMLPDIAPHETAVYTVDASVLLGDRYHDFVKLYVSTEVADADHKDNTTYVVLTQGGFNAHQLGDIDFSGSVDVTDAVLALKIFAVSMLENEDETYTDIQKNVADADGNAVVDTADAIAILQYYAKYNLFEDDMGSTSFEQFMEDYLKKEATSNESETV